VDRHPDPGRLAWFWDFWRELARGSVGVLRWTDLPLPPFVYPVAGVGAALLAGCTIRWLRTDANSEDRRAAAVITCAFVAFALGVAWYSLRVDYQPQGRHLVSVLVAGAGVAGAALGRVGFMVAAALLVGLLVCAIGTALATFGLPV
jgi:hypothetical protein